MERRVFELRYTGEGRILSGVALVYNQPTKLPWGLEQFDSRAFSNVDSENIILNVQHERPMPIARTGGGGLVLSDSDEQLSMEAALPPTTLAEDTLQNVRAKILRGLSVRFAPIRESFRGGVRYIHEAVLDSIGVVDIPQYIGSEVAARAKQYRGFRVWL